MPATSLEIHINHCTATALRYLVRSEIDRLNYRCLDLDDCNAAAAAEVRQVVNELWAIYCDLAACFSHIEKA